jgi:pyridoxal phosphatase
MCKAPDNGALISGIETASGRKAINVGKPSLELSKWIMEENDLLGEETLMVSDRLHTDIKFGNTGGMKSALVLTGCVKATQIEEVLLTEDKNDMIPTIIIPHVGYLGYLCK